MAGFPIQETPLLDVLCLAPQNRIFREGPVLAQLVSVLGSEDSTLPAVRMRQGVQGQSLDSLVPVRMRPIDDVSRFRSLYLFT